MEKAFPRHQHRFADAKSHLLCHGVRVAGVATVATHRVRYERGEEKHCEENSNKFGNIGISRGEVRE